MGLAIERERFDQADYLYFQRRLDESLLALERLLRRPGFGTGPPTVGAELELFLVDSGGRALPINQTVRAEAADPRVVLEVDRFNLELNLTPAPLAGRPFAAMGSELDQALGIVRRAAAWHGGRIVMVGILPTLGPKDLQLAALSDAPRYRALNNGLRRLRQEPFRVRIGGADPLELAADDIGLEGANTSFQVHLRVDPDASPTTTTPPSWPPARSWPSQATPPPASATGSGRRPGWPCSSRRSTTATPPAGPADGCPGSRSGPAGPGRGRWSCWRRASGCTSRCSRWSAPSSRWTASATATGSRLLRSCGCTRAPCGAGTGPSTTRPTAATCASRCAPSRPGPPWSTCWPTPPSCSA